MRTPMPAPTQGQRWRFATRSAATALPEVDIAAFGAEVRALRIELESDLGDVDLVHLKQMERWGRAATLLGFATAWMGVNPLAALALALGQSARWTMMAHHVLHRGYDRVPGVPHRFHSAVFARGWRRWLDWPDWILPQAWSHEHNQLHHFHTGELGDPDLVEHNAWLLRLRAIPRPLKWVLIGVLMLTWKVTYYAPNTFWAWREHLRAKRRGATAAAQSTASGADGVSHPWRLLYPGERLLLPVSLRAWHYWLRSALPFALFRFGLLPALFLPLGEAAWWAVLVNLLIAEALSQLHTFFIIVPNHAGDDLYRFDDHFADRNEFILRQVVGSVNYPGGSDVKDFLQGYLNYQIEHHVWPDLPMLKYRQAAPRLKAICARHGVPYIEQSVFRRFGKLWAIMNGDADMRRAPAREAPIATAVGD